MKLNEEKIKDIVSDPDQTLMIFQKSCAYYTSNMSYAYKEMEKRHSFEFSEIAKWLGSKLSDTYKRAYKNNIRFNLTQKNLIELYLKQQGRCSLTGVVMQCERGTLYDKGMLNISIDRIDNCRGYVPDNIRLVTHWANNAKSTYTDDEFYQMVKHSAMFKDN